MAFELIYTSAPKGLKPGSRGFATVACTEGMPANYVSACESLSGYSFVFDPHDPNYSKSPIAYSHYVFQLGGQRLSLLSRVAAFGTDYSGRTNKLAYHVLVPPSEYKEGGPAAVMVTPQFLTDSWSGEPHVIRERKKVPATTPAGYKAQFWQRVTGDGAWAGVIADRFLLCPDKPVFLIFGPGMDLLPLVTEIIALLPPERRWDFTFNTFFTTLPQGSDCFLRCCLTEAEALKASRRLPGTLVINLGSPPPPPAESSGLAASARNGDEPGWVGRDDASSGKVALAGGRAVDQNNAVTEKVSERRPAIQAQRVHVVTMPAIRTPSGMPFMLILGVAAAAIIVVGAVVATYLLRSPSGPTQSGREGLHDLMISKTTADGLVKSSATGSPPSLPLSVGGGVVSNGTGSNAIVRGEAKDVATNDVHNTQRHSTTTLDPLGSTNAPVQFVRLMTVLGKSGDEVMGVPPTERDIDVEVVPCIAGAEFEKVPQPAPVASISGSVKNKKVFTIRRKERYGDVAFVEVGGTNSIKVFILETNTVQAIVLSYTNKGSSINHLVWLQSCTLDGAKSLTNTGNVYTLAVPPRWMKLLSEYAASSNALSVSTPNKVPAIASVIRLSAIRLLDQGILFSAEEFEEARGDRSFVSKADSGIAAIKAAMETLADAESVATNAVNDFKRKKKDNAQDSIVSAAKEKQKRAEDDFEQKLADTVRCIESNAPEVKNQGQTLREDVKNGKAKYGQVVKYAQKATEGLQDRAASSRPQGVQWDTLLTDVVVNSGTNPIIRWKK